MRAWRPGLGDPDVIVQAFQLFSEIVAAKER